MSRTSLTTGFFDDCTKYEQACYGEMLAHDQDSTTCCRSNNFLLHAPAEDNVFYASTEALRARHLCNEEQRYISRSPESSLSQSPRSPRPPHRDEMNRNQPQEQNISRMELRVDA